MTAGAAPKESSCPRCERAFHCGVSDAQPCTCTTIALDGETLLQLRERYDRCLCIACLAELQAAAR